MIKRPFLPHPRESRPLPTRSTDSFERSKFFINGGLSNVSQAIRRKLCSLKISTPIISGETLKTQIYELTRIRPQNQRLCTGCRDISEETLITASEDAFFPSVHLLLRLLGGKGGFGSLLRGAASKAGQKKTINFDACRDMSGRRLRHVNAEKKSEEWKADAEERKLEKVAEDFLKKQAKAAKKSGSALVKTVKDVDGKRNLDESDSDEEEDKANNDDDEKSVILNDGSSSGHSKEREGSWSLNSISDSQAERESSGGNSTESNFEEENDVPSRRGFELVEASRSKAVHAVAEVSVASELCIVSIVPRPGNSDLETEAASGSKAVQTGGTGSLEPESGNQEEQVGQATSVTVLEEVKGSQSGAIAAEPPNYAVEPKLGNHEMVVEDVDISDMERPLNFEEFNSAAEMEVLGMESSKQYLWRCLPRNFWPRNELILDYSILIGALSDVAWLHLLYKNNWDVRMWVGTLAPNKILAVVKPQFNQEINYGRVSSIAIKDEKGAGDAIFLSVTTV
ncbi:hypothetical protein NE237_027863 [Protea cynaroides]|uniref:SDE2-like domain-containing protein n=1 Tax=Protea cynaroides TaxID=273540 RepID=A0A9Q0JTE2_9MAGN|nr:hypothetical protein NE237_027863 [Protea cynaroides]